MRLGIDNLVEKKGLDDLFNKAALDLKGGLELSLLNRQTFSGEQAFFNFAVPETQIKEIADYLFSAEEYLSPLESLGVLSQEREGVKQKIYDALDAKSLRYFFDFEPGQVVDLTIIDSGSLKKQALRNYSVDMGFESGHKKSWPKLSDKNGKIARVTKAEVADIDGLNAFAEDKFGVVIRSYSIASLPGDVLSLFIKLVKPNSGLRDDGYGLATHEFFRIEDSIANDNLRVLIKPKMKGNYLFPPSSELQSEIPLDYYHVKLSSLGFESGTLSALSKSGISNVGQLLEKLGTEQKMQGIGELRSAEISEKLGDLGYLQTIYLVGRGTGHAPHDPMLMKMEKEGTLEQFLKYRKIVVIWQVGKGYEAEPYLKKMQELASKYHNLDFMPMRSRDFNPSEDAAGLEHYDSEVPKNRIEEIFFRGHKGRIKKESLAEMPQYHLINTIFSVPGSSKTYRIDSRSVVMACGDDILTSAMKTIADYAHAGFRADEFYKADK